MNRNGLVPGMLIAFALLPGVWAGDSPEVAQRKQELTLAYQLSHTHGICGVYGDLRDWQAANWPEGKSAVTDYRDQKILPRFIQDPAALAGKTAEEIELEFTKLCTQTSDGARQVLSSLETAEAKEKEELRASMLLATFLGQCRAASALYFDAKPDQKKMIDKFVKDEVYAQDARYRQVEIDHDAMLEGNLSAELDKSKANEEREIQYWKDCDTVDAKFKEIFGQLQPAP